MAQRLKKATFTGSEIRRFAGLALGSVNSRHYTACIAVAAGMVLLTGCGKEQDSAGKPSKTPGITATASPSVPIPAPVSDATTNTAAATPALLPQSTSARLVVNTTTGNKPIKRDYDQTVMITVKNDSAISATLAAAASSPFEDLLADFTGPGSGDEPMALLAGETAELRLAVTAADAQSDSYEIPISIGGAVTTAKISISQPIVKLAMEILKEDPVTLIKTVQLINQGSPLTDLDVKVGESSAADLAIEPSVGHGNLSAAAKKKFDLTPVLYYEFQKLETELVCRASGKEFRFPLKFEAPAGKRLMGYRTASQDRSNSQDWYCTNKPNTCSDLPAGSATGPAPQILLASAGNFAPSPPKGTCETCPQDECCKKHYVANGDVGGVVCCDGKIYVCVWLEPDDSIARNIMRECTRQHEQRHKDQGGECNSRGRYVPHNEDSLPAFECEAHEVSIGCLKTGLNNCKQITDPVVQADCIKRVEYRIRFHRHLNDTFYCKGKLPPEGYQPPF